MIFLFDSVRAGGGSSPFVLEGKTEEAVSNFPKATQGPGSTTLPDSFSRPTERPTVR